MKFSKKDFLFSVITGVTAGAIAWRIFVFLNVPRFDNLSFVWLIFFVPVLWILGVNLGYFLGRWLSFFSQFGKFSAIGFTNAAVDFGVLNLLIAYSDISSGGWFSFFKGISFAVAIVHSFFWNKYWVFQADKEGAGGTEFLKFVSVAVVALLINVGTASFVVNLVPPFPGFTPQAWANMGAVAGAAVALAFSFIGFKLLVFKK